jgi:[protein-PII] uridylyltransferase
VTLSAATREVIPECLGVLAAHTRRPRHVAAAFLGILRARGHVSETLFEMHKLGVLCALIPEFKNLDCLIAHDPFHIYTVDHHSLMGVREVERLRAGEFARTLPHLTQVMNEVQRPELLFLGMMFHDVGKGHGHDHSGRGARMMRDIAARLGLNEDETAACEFLVQHHLLMSHLAQRRDVHDDQLIADFCSLVGNVDNLQRLYVLTYADMRAVGPGVWNNWRDSAPRRALRARASSSRKAPSPEDCAAQASRIRTRVPAATRPFLRPDMEAFIASMPDAYVLSTPERCCGARRSAAASPSARRRASGRRSRPIWTHFPSATHSELAICTRDRPALLDALRRSRRTA